MKLVSGLGRLTQPAAGPTARRDGGATVPLGTSAMLSQLRRRVSATGSAVRPPVTRHAGQETNRAAPTCARIDWWSAAAALVGGGTLAVAGPALAGSPGALMVMRGWQFSDRQERGLPWPRAQGGGQACASLFMERAASAAISAAGSPWPEPTCTSSRGGR